MALRRQIPPRSPGRPSQRELQRTGKAPEQTPERELSLSKDCNCPLSKGQRNTMYVRTHVRTEVRMCVPTSKLRGDLNDRMYVPISITSCRSQRSYDRTYVCTYVRTHIRSTDTYYARARDMHRTRKNTYVRGVRAGRLCQRECTTPSRPHFSNFHTYSNSQKLAVAFLLTHSRNQSLFPAHGTDPHPELRGKRYKRHTYAASDSVRTYVRGPLRKRRKRLGNPRELSAATEQERHQQG